jgi:hypothetical protein
VYRLEFAIFVAGFRAENPIDAEKRSARNPPARREKTL